MSQQPLFLSSATTLSLIGAPPGTDLTLHTIHDGLWDWRTRDSQQHGAAAVHADADEMAVLLESCAHAVSLAAMGTAAERAGDANRIASFDEGTSEVGGFTVLTRSLRAGRRPAHTSEVTAVGRSADSIDFRFEAMRCSDAEDAVWLAARGPRDAFVEWSSGSSEALSLARSMRAAATEVTRRSAPSRQRSALPLRGERAPLEPVHDGDG